MYYTTIPVTEIFPKDIELQGAGKIKLKKLFQIFSREFNGTFQNMKCRTRTHIIRNFLYITSIKELNHLN